MRTAIILALSHPTDKQPAVWSMLADPSVNFLEQKKMWRGFLGSKAHPEYSLITYQESDGHLLKLHLRTPDFHASHESQRAKENKATTDQAELDQKNRATAEQKYQEQQAQARADELKALEAQVDPERVKSAKSTKVAANGQPEGSTEALTLRLDGPTVEEWGKAGYSAASYPPAGYAAVTKEQRSPEVNAAIEKQLRADASEDAVPVGELLIKASEIVEEKTEGAGDQPPVAKGNKKNK